MSKSSNDGFEEDLAGWYENMPHMPKNVREQLARNVWWLVLIGTIASTLGLLYIIPVFFAEMTYAPYEAIYGIRYDAISRDIGRLSASLTLIGHIITTVLMAVAASPLKARLYAGWRILFWSFAINFILSILSMVLIVNLLSIAIMVALAVAVGYVLFEIRDCFDDFKLNTNEISTRKN
ncbi:MAG: hypothetical protein H6797_02115 [Candidatus Nomurabacteria bacterium]|nr:MAG: hypothetical protein H6797_02115 [Candidatus Nomurabacteria bacterium]